MDKRNDDILKDAAEYLLWRQKRARRNKRRKVLIVLAILGVLCICAFLYVDGKRVVPEKDSGMERTFREEWEKEAEHVKLTGNQAEDVLAVAESQVGYTESNGGDFSTEFVLFCLSYAKVKDFPLETDCSQWVQKLRNGKQGIYHDADEYTPTPGDLVFFNMDGLAGGDIADHVGIVAEVIADEGASQAKLKTVEGDAKGSVNYVVYDLADARITGYGKLSDAQ